MSWVPAPRWAPPAVWGRSRWRTSSRGFSSLIWLWTCEGSRPKVLWCCARRIFDLKPAQEPVTVSDVAPPDGGSRLVRDGPTIRRRGASQLIKWVKWVIWFACTRWLRFDRWQYATRPTRSWFLVRVTDTILIYCRIFRDFRFITPFINNLRSSSPSTVIIASLLKCANNIQIIKSVIGAARDVECAVRVYRASALWGFCNADKTRR